MKGRTSSFLKTKEKKPKRCVIIVKVYTRSTNESGVVQYVVEFVGKRKMSQKMPKKNWNNPREDT